MKKIFLLLCITLGTSASPDAHAQEAATSPINNNSSNNSGNSYGNSSNSAPSNNGSTVSMLEAPQQFYFGFGPGIFSNMNSSAIAMVLTPGVMWTLDPQFDLGVTADMAFSLHHNDTRFFSPQLKGRFFIEPDRPYYVGLGLGFGYSHSHSSTGKPSDTTTGFASSLTVGGKFYRSSNVQLSVELDHQFIWSSSDYGTPQMTFIKVGVHFY